MTGSPDSSLQHHEAIERFETVQITSYDVVLDLASDEETFGSRTTIVFESTGATTFVDVKPVRINEVRLNGARLDPESLDRGRLILPTEAGTNELVVDAVMRFRSDGEGLHRSVDPADGRHYVYGMSFLDAAPSIFACFDQPDLKAPYIFHVQAPPEWTVFGNAPGTQVSCGQKTAQWEFEWTQPLSTYFVTLVAGPWHAISTEHDGIRLGLTARHSIADALERDADEILTVTRQCFDEFHRLFDDRYPFGDYHQAFVPDFNAGAMENPGCVTLRDPYLFTSKMTRGAQCIRASTIAHELAHQWFGNIATPKWWDDLWLNESFAEYMGNRVTADVTEFDDAWVRNAYQRRQWGLIADAGPTTHSIAGNVASDAVAALQDFDGISYAKGSSVLKQLNARLGDEIFFAGVNDHFATHRFGNATMHDLFDSWERAGAGDLSDVTQGWLRTSGVDRIALDRSSGLLRRTPPGSEPVERRHAFNIAVVSPDGTWRREAVSLEDATAISVSAEDSVVLDVDETSWLVAQLDQQTLTRLPSLMPMLTDDTLRVAVWNNVRSSFETASISPEAVLDLAVASIPGETNDEPLSFNGRSSDPSKLLLAEWLLTKVAPLSADPIASFRALHAAYATRVATADHGSTVQHAAFMAAVESSTSSEEIARWLEGDLPAGVSLDLALRWRMLTRLACLGAVDRSELDQHLADEANAISKVEHARAAASLPTAEAKQWAWDRFLGVEDVPNYELQASGQGMWQPGQESLTNAYVDKFFDDLPGTASHRIGWLLAEAACWFFPLTSLTEQTIARSEQLAADEGLDPALRRQLVIMAAELRQRIAVRSEP